MGSEQILWDDAPPEDDGRYIKILPAPTFGTVHLACVSSALVGCWTHFVEARTIPCTLGNGGCICKRDGLASRWRGYLCCWHVQQAELFLVELTNEAVKHCNIDLTNPPWPLRGALLKLYRSGRTKRSPVRIEFAQASLIIPNMPDEPDVRAALWRVWCGPSKRAQQ